MLKAKVNAEQCKAVGKLLQPLTIKPSAYNREFISFEADGETKLRAYLFCVAICHQTHALINKRLNLVASQLSRKSFCRFSQNRQIYSILLLSLSKRARNYPRG